MAGFSCADASRSAGEPLIGSAGRFGLYALIECPGPWAPNAFASPQVPDGLRRALAEIGRPTVPLRALLIRGEDGAPRTRVLVFRAKAGRSSGCAGEEFEVPDLGGVGGLAKDYMAGRPIAFPSRRTATRDILVCTHGAHDRCCGLYGAPFYEEARRTVRDLDLPDVRIWQSSHLGGHRFAPTILDFPEGRCYGALDRDAFASILTRTGDVGVLRRVYRGWTLLPHAAQVLERELLLLHGWAWLGWEVEGRVVEEARDRRASRVEIAFRKPDGSGGRYTADVVPDVSRSIPMAGDCHRSDPFAPRWTVTPSVVRDLRFSPEA